MTEQEVAIEYKGKFLAIVASAGSGKTRTLVERIVREIRDFGTSPSDIIAFTFTNKAADELKTRIYTQLGGEVNEDEFSDLFIGTIHGYCHQFLENLGDYFNFDVLDELQLQSLIYRLYDHLELQQVYSHSYSRNIEQFLKDYGIYENELLAETDLPSSIRTPILKLNELLRSNRLLTFGSMVRLACEEIKKQGGLRQLKHLFVDEFQDINPAQEKLIRAMAVCGSKLTVVGDDLQCIYQWRGSDISYILDFEKAWGGATRILSNNFRSRKDIVLLADRFSKTIEPRYKEKTKTMKPVRIDRKTRQNAFWAPASTENEQNTILADLVEKALSAGYKPNELAILLRSVKSSALPIVNELESRNLPVYCPQISVVQGSVINDLFVPLFKLLSSRDPKNQAEREHQEALFDDFWSAFSKLQTDNNAKRRGLTVYREWLRSIENRESKSYNIRFWLYKFLAESAVCFTDNDRDMLSQIGVLTRTIRAVEETNRRNIAGVKRKTPQNVYAHLSSILENQTDKSVPSYQAAKDINAIFVSTVHQAKGLEWPVVFLPSITHNLFPVRRRSHGTSFPDSIASRYGTNDIDERRLFYVATTRAKDHLVIEGFPNRGKISRFLSDDGSSTLLKPTKKSENIVFEKTRATEHSDEIISIGISDLLLLIECPRQYGFRRLFGIYPQIGDELGYGRSLHEIIRRSIRDGKWLSKDEILELVERYTFIPLESDRAQAIHKNSIRNQVLALTDVEELAEVRSTEIPVTFRIGKTQISGVIDSYLENEKGQITLIDWKTSIQDDFLERYRKQLQLYAYALRKKKKNIIGAALIDVKKTSSFKTVEKEDVDTSNASLSHLEKDLKKEIDRLHSLDFVAYPSSQTCGVCDMRYICADRVGG